MGALYRHAGFVYIKFQVCRSMRLYKQPWYTILKTPTLDMYDQFMCSMHMSYHIYLFDLGTLGDTLPARSYSMPRCSAGLALEMKIRTVTWGVGSVGLIILDLTSAGVYIYTCKSLCINPAGLDMYILWVCRLKFLKGCPQNQHRSIESNIYKNCFTIYLCISIKMWALCMTNSSVGVGMNLLAIAAEDFLYINSENGYIFIYLYIYISRFAICDWTLTADRSTINIIQDLFVFHDL